MSYRPENIPDDLDKKLAVLAESTGKTKDAITAEAIQSYVDYELWQLQEIDKAIEKAELGHFASKEKVSSVFAKWGVNAD